jgi:hypothetical protein
MIKTNIYTVNDAPWADLEPFLLKNQFTLLYVSKEYLQMLEGFLSCDISVLIAFKDDHIEGYFPLAFKRNALYGNICNSLPFYGSNGGIIVTPGRDEDGEIKAALLLAGERLIKQNKCVASTIISNPLDGRTDEWLKENTGYDLIDERIGQITHLPQKTEGSNEESLLKTFEDPRPRNIRKALKEGVTVSFSNTADDLDFLYKVHFDNISAINGIAKEKRFFDCVPKYFNNKQFRIYVAEYKGEKIGALLLFYNNNTVEYFTPAVIETYRNVQPSALLIYQAMLDAIKNGLKNWNWGGTWLTQGGVYEFKKKWGTTDYRYYYYIKIYDKSILEQSRETLLKEYPYFFVVPFSSLK